MVSIFKCSIFCGYCFKIFRDETGTADSLLADKRTVKELKSLYDEYNYEYEDEYDDTYDANDVGAGDADSADELTQMTSRSLMGPPMRYGDDAEGNSPENKDDNSEVGL